jgi:hypothetical protein
LACTIPTTNSRVYAHGRNAYSVKWWWRIAATSTIAKVLRNLYILLLTFHAND